MTTTTTDTKPNATKATDDEIDAAILAALADAGGAQRPVSSATIARRVPGTSWQQTQAVVRLWQAWKINAVKVRGRTYLSLSDATDELILTNNLGCPGQRVLPVVP